MSVFVWVPQEDGEIILTQEDTTRRWVVDNHLVTAQNAFERDRLVQYVTDARDATAQEQGAKTRRSRRTSTPASPDEPPAVEAGGEDTDEPEAPAPTPQE